MLYSKKDICGIKYLIYQISYSKDIVLYTNLDI